MPQDVDDAVRIAIRQVRRVTAEVAGLSGAASPALRRQFVDIVTDLVDTSRRKGFSLRTMDPVGRLTQIGQQDLEAGFDGVEITGSVGPRSPGTAVWGPAHTASEAAAARAAMQDREFAGRRELTALSLTRAEVAKLLSVSDVAVTGYLSGSSRCLLGFKTGRRWAIPAWQLDAGSERGFLPGLGRLARAFPGGIVQLSRWVQRPHPDLRGRAPRDALAAGDVDLVVDRAASITAAGW